VVWFLGFQPGFPISAACRSDAATRGTASAGPGGSVGIGGAQTGVYPLATPGGWQLLGRTPLALFDPMRQEPVLLRSGDRVRFVPQKEGYVEDDPRRNVSSVQDGGREGQRQSGISRCGALDKPAGDCQSAGGQRANAAALEITLGQVDIQFERDCWFALTGAACEATLDGKPVWVGWRMAAKAGQHLVLKNPQYGIRSYLAVAGGIDVPKVLGSRCTDLKVGIGGLEGRRLQDGDRLKLGNRPADSAPRAALNSCRSATASARCRGRSTTNLISVSQGSFWRSPWQLSAAEQPYGLSPAGATAYAHHRSRNVLARPAAGRGTGTA
jgi:biotin-dependent carboxylase-like uncharacterized protein